MKNLYKLVSYVKVESLAFAISVTYLFLLHITTFKCFYYMEAPECALCVHPFYNKISRTIRLQSRKYNSCCVSECWWLAYCFESCLNLLLFVNTALG